MKKADESISRVVIFPRGQLNVADKARFIKAGVLIAEADDPEQVKQLNLAPPIKWEQSLVSADAVFSSLLQALAARSPMATNGDINSVGWACHEFVKNLAASLPKASA